VVGRVRSTGTRGGACHPSFGDNPQLHSRAAARRPLLAPWLITSGHSGLRALVGASAVPLVGFLLTGVVIGPNALGFVADESLVESAG
jgi:hypothetical protein